MKIIDEGVAKVVQVKPLSFAYVNVEYLLWKYIQGTQNGRYWQSSLCKPTHNSSAGHDSESSKYYKYFEIVQTMLWVFYCHTYSTQPFLEQFLNIRSAVRCVINLYGGRYCYSR